MNPIQHMIANNFSSFGVNPPVIHTTVKSRILVVDDEAAVRRVLIKILSNNGYECVQAPNASVAREIIKTESIDLIFCDIKMPGESGLEFISFVHDQYPHIATIVLSAADDPSTVKTAMDLCVYGYLVKPFTMSDILINSLNALRRRDLELKEKSYRQDLESKVRMKTAELLETANQSEMEREKFALREKNYRTVITHMSEALQIIQDGVVVYSNPALFELFNLEMAEFSGIKTSVPFTDAIHEDDKAMVEDRYHRRLRGENVPSRYSFRINTRDGELKWLEVNATPIEWKGRPAVLCLLKDITEQKIADENLKMAHKEMEQLVIAISSILIGVSKQGLITRWNQPAEKILGLNASAVLNTPLRECDMPWNWKKIAEGIQQCMETSMTVLIDDIPYTKLNGKNGFLAFNINPIRKETGEITGCLMLGNDITERKLLIAQLSQAQKLESIGQLAAGIAHEINTPTQYVADNARFLRDAFDDLHRVLAQYRKLRDAIKAKQLESDLIAHLDHIIEEADEAYLEKEIPAAIRQTMEGIDRVGEIVRSMREFSHMKNEEKVAVDINKALESAITVTRNEWKYLSDVEVDFDPDLPLVLCNRGEVNQVFLNIIVNAAHAIADVVGDNSNEKGKIRIETKLVNSMVDIRISDTGSGIPENIQSKIFDPFFTTKDVGKGTGQGLAIAYSAVVEKHQGLLSFTTVEGKGTTFIIKLPVGEKI